FIFFLTLLPLSFLSIFLFFFFFLMIPPPPTSTLFPYTTLFRSRRLRKSSPCLSRSQSMDWSRLPARHRCQARQRRFLTAHSLPRSEEHTSELQSLAYLVCRLLLEKKKKKQI